MGNDRPEYEFKAAQRKDALLALEALERCVNRMGGDAAVQEAVEDFFNAMHPTLQQSMMRNVLVPAIQVLATRAAQGFTDARNRAACTAALKMANAIADDNVFPFI